MTTMEFVHAIRGIRNALKHIDAKEMLRYAEVAAMERKKGFQEGVGPDGKSWPELKPATIMRKTGAHKTTRARKGELVTGKVKGYGSRLSRALKKGASTASISPTSPLIDTGALMTPTIHATTNQGRVHLATSRILPVSGGKSISTIHDKGSGHIPKRHHWGIYPEAEKKIRDYFALYVSRIMRREVR